MTVSSSDHNTPAAPAFSIEERLLLECHSRTSMSVWPALMTIGCLWFVFWDTINGTLWPVVGVVLTVSLLIRALMDRIFVKGPQDALRFMHFYQIVYIANSMAWGLGAASVIKAYGTLSYEGTAFLLAMMTFSCGSSYAMAPRLLLQRLYMFCAVTPLTVVFFMQAHDLRSSFMGCATLFFIAYTMSVGKKQNIGLRHSYELLEAQRSKAEYSARLATLGEMAGGVAHEINNPLAMIMGHSTQLIREIDREVLDRDKLRHKAERINKTVTRIAKIVQGLRTFSRAGEADPMVSTSLPALIEETLELCQSRFSQGGVSLDIAPVPDILFLGRTVQISQVLINLLNNAFDAVKNSQRKIVAVSFDNSDGKLRILITDSGPGIPANIARRIFEPFFTTKDVGQGTGLGLSVSKSIMQEHGGDLALLMAGQPTTFEMTLSTPEARKSQAA